MQVRFDRGTIVIGGELAERDPGGLPGVKWDPRVHAWRAPAAAYAEVMARLGAHLKRVVT